MEEEEPKFVDSGDDHDDKGLHVDGWPCLAEEWRLAVTSELA